MSLDNTKANIRNKYLNPVGADFWFVFGDERVPGHKYVLESVHSWLLNTMLNGSLPVENEVNVRNCDIPIEAFKEFLRFIYRHEVNFTMDNIEEIIKLAKLSLVDEFFVKCESFLIESLTIENIAHEYKLALRYGANRLKKRCEEEMGVNAEHFFKSSTFLNFPYNLLEHLLMCDTLMCEEKHIFNACVLWAKAACERNGQNSSHLENVRAKLGKSIYQIRFSSMTRGDVADCISSGLLTNEELIEINCIIGRKTEFQSKKFNWTARNLRLHRTNERELVCSRVYSFDYVRLRFDPNPIMHKLNSIEQTRFVSNEWLLLNGFTCEGIVKRGLINIPMVWESAQAERQCSVNVKISQINSSDDDDIDKLFSERATLRFTKFREFGRTLLYKADVNFKPAIIIRPKRKYIIELQFSNEPSIHNYCDLSTIVSVDHDILIRFDGKKGLISSLNISRISEKSYLKKIIQDPYLVAATTMSLIGYFGFKILKK